MPQREGLHEGEVFAGYTIIRRLGAGGMGEVYLAQHPRLPRHDALKVLPRDLTADLEFRQRFNREADLAASLFHEHIVGIHDRGEHDGQLWISMDYVPGIDADKLLRGQYPSGMPRKEVVEIITAVAEALDYAHARGLLHRDVKPANILLGDGAPHRRILLADFGIARELGDISGLTATNMLMGTTAYCSPEQLQGSELDARADQYALGCTAFNLLTGSAPFHHSNPAVIISHHLSVPPPQIGERRPELSDLNPVIARALAKKPGARYATCADFAAALAGTPVTAVADAAGPTEVIAAPTEVLRATQTAPPASPKARGRLGPATIVAALVAVALVGIAAVVGVHMVRASRSGDGARSPASVAAPPASAIPLSSQVTDQSGVLTPAERLAVERAVNKLHNARGTRLWVVYVKSFGELRPFKWAEQTMRANGFGDTDAILAIATEKPSFSFRVPGAVVNGKAIDVETIRRDRIEPAVARREWTRAALAAANGLDVAPG